VRWVQVFVRASGGNPLDARLQRSGMTPALASHSRMPAQRAGIQDAASERFPSSPWMPDTLRGAHLHLLPLRFGDFVRAHRPLKGSAV
jgi:hypothetical protein